MVNRVRARERIRLHGGQPAGEGGEQTIADNTRADDPYYRKQWDFDRVVKGTHLTNCAQQGRCIFNLYIKDGKVLREELTGDYPQTASNVPDYNPRGCQKGVCYSDRMYDPTRLQYPLKRVGGRGEGKWQRVSWDEALTEIADTLLDVLINEGPDRIIWDIGSQGRTQDQTAPGTILARALDTVDLQITGDNGDEMQGAAVTFGKIICGSSAENFFYSDLILNWGGNPAYTFVPVYHFITEARYAGTKIVTISPDYSPSAIHADEWIPVNIGSDAALALSMAHVIVREELYKATFVREQTDLPLLVRLDSRKVLKEADLEEGGRQDSFYFFDLNSQSVRKASRTTLSLGEMLPALEGEYEVETLQGKVTVTPVFRLLKDRLEEYSPEKTSGITGVGAHTIKRLAREIAQANAVTNVSTQNWGKFYHGDLIERSIILIFALCGHFGRKGATYQAMGQVALDCSIQGVITGKPTALAASGIVLDAEGKDEGLTEEMQIYEGGRQVFAQKILVGSSLFHYIHSGIAEVSRAHNSWDLYLKRPLGDYLREALARGWQFVAPDPGKEPRIMFELGGNFVRRVRMNQQVIRTLLPKLRLLVTFDARMSTTALFSDFVLPTASHYEKWAITQASEPMMQHITRKAVEPPGESKPEWEIFILMAKKIEERARERGLSSFVDRQGQRRRLDDLYRRATVGGRYGVEEQERFTRDLLASASNLPKDMWESLTQKGFAPITGLGKHLRSIGNACEVVSGEVRIPFTWHTDKKQPYPTHSRRMQFYIDHDWYLELGEELPIHKDGPKAGGAYPLQLSGGHSRWSIHTSWADHALMLRLQRGEPLMFMSVADAVKRGIRDGDEVDVWNDIGSFRIQAAVAPRVRPGQVIVYHQWEPFQFVGGPQRSFRSVMATPLNPVELAGGYGHLRPCAFILYPGFSDRDTRVEVAKVREEATMR